MTCVCTVAWETFSSRAICLFPSPRVIALSTSTSRSVRPAGHTQDALGVIGVQANPLPLGLIERTAFDPHPIGHAHHAEVVDLRRAPYCDGVVRAQPCIQGGSLCDLCNSG